MDSHTQEYSMRPLLKTEGSHAVFSAEIHKLEYTETTLQTPKRIARFIMALLDERLGALSII